MPGGGFEWSEPIKPSATIRSNLATGPPCEKPTSSLRDLLGSHRSEEGNAKKKKRHVPGPVYYGGDNTAYVSEQINALIDGPNSRYFEREGDDLMCTMEGKARELRWSSIRH